MHLHLPYPHEHYLALQQTELSSGIVARKATDEFVCLSTASSFTGRSKKSQQLVPVIPESSFAGSQLA